MNQQFTIKSLKYDGNLRRRWTCELVEREPDLLTFLGTFDFEVEHPDLGLIKKGTQSYEYYWLDRWYNVFRFHEPDGQFRNFYCNVNMPPVLRDNVLEYVDLDIDILVWPDGQAIDLDLDEFEQSAERFNYPGEVKANAMSAVKDLKALLESRQFPFDDKYFI